MTNPDLPPPSPGPQPVPSPPGQGPASPSFGPEGTVVRPSTPGGQPPGAPPPGQVPPGGPPSGGSNSAKIVVLLIVAVLAVAGIVVVALQVTGDDSASGDTTPATDDPEPDDTTSDDTEPDDTEPDDTEPSSLQFCEAMAEFEDSGALEGEEPSAAEMDDIVDQLRSIDPPADIADAWDEWVDVVSELSDMLADDASDTDLADLFEEHESAITDVGDYVETVCRGSDEEDDDAGAPGAAENCVPDDFWQCIPDLTAQQAKERLESAGWYCVDEEITGDIDCDVEPRESPDRPAYGRMSVTIQLFEDSDPKRVTGFMIWARQREQGERPNVDQSYDEAMETVLPLLFPDAPDWVDELIDWAHENIGKCKDQGDPVILRGYEVSCSEERTGSGWGDLVLRVWPHHTD